jgi:hypothetical protein
MRCAQGSERAETTANGVHARHHEPGGAGPIFDPSRGRGCGLYEDLPPGPCCATASAGTAEGIGDAVRPGRTRVDQAETGGPTWNRTRDLSLIRTAL